MTTGTVPTPRPGGAGQNTAFEYEFRDDPPVRYGREVVSGPIAENDLTAVLATVGRSGVFDPETVGFRLLGAGPHILTLVELTHRPVTQDRTAGQVVAAFQAAARAR